MDKPSTKKEETENKKNPLVNCLAEFSSKFWKRLHDPRFVIEIVALVGLVFYVCETKRTNDLTQGALDLNKRLIKTAQAASITAEMGFAGKGSTVNIGFANHGKTATTLLAHYDITLESLPSEKQLRIVGSETVTDSIPREGEPKMPNHFYEIDGFTGEDLALYRSSQEGIRISGTFQYDDGFGEIISKQFCLVSASFQVMECGNGVRRYILSLSPQSK
jgi:hypothetical protein